MTICSQIWSAVRRKVLPGAGVAVLVLALASPAFSADVIERIVARVNGRMILQSDWDREARCGALLAGHSLAEVQASPEESRQALDRLIEHQLLHGEGILLKPTAVDAPEVKQKIAEAKLLAIPAADGKVSATASDIAWQARLAGYGVTEMQLQQYFAVALDLERVVEVKLRPGLRVDDDEVERYYTQELLPRLKPDAEPAPLAQVAPQIRDILTERAINQALEAWLQDLRRDADIWIEPSVARSSAQAASVAAGASGGSR